MLYFFSHPVGFLKDSEKTVYFFNNHYVIKDPKNPNIAKIVNKAKIIFYDSESETDFYNNYQSNINNKNCDSLDQSLI